MANASPTVGARIHWTGGISMRPRTGTVVEFVGGDMWIKWDGARRMGQHSLVPTNVAAESTDWAILG